MIDNSRRHRDINRLKRFFRSIGLPFHAHSSLHPAPDDWRFPGIWLEPDGLHFFQGYSATSPGRLGHEAGHLQLMSPEDRARVVPGCLIDQDIDTCTDMAVEAWAGAAAIAAGVELENMFTDFEDYQVGDTADKSMIPFSIGINLLTKEHPGVMILQVMGMTGDDYPKMHSWAADTECLRRFESIKNEVNAAESAEGQS